MKEKNGIKVADKSIRNVPLGLWCKFAGHCKSRNITITAGIIEAINLYFEEWKER